MKFLLISVLLIYVPTAINGVEAPEDTPSKYKKMLSDFDDDAEKLRAKTEREINKMREELIEDFEKEMKTVTKRGKLDEALQLKTIIEGLEEEQQENTVNVFGKRRITKPRLNFVAEKSMPLYPIGTQHHPFAAMETNDPLAVFEGKGIFFDQRTDVDDVIYEVELPRTARKLLWEGGAAQNMTIKIYDAKGNEIGSGGPWGGGNRPLAFEVPMKPSNRFRIQIHNDVSHWYYISKLSFE